MGRALLLAAATAGATVVPGGAAAQETPAADSLVAPDTVARDTIRRDRRVQAFPPLREPGGAPPPTWECDRSCLLENPDLTLVELLERHVPGLVPLRAGYFGGPHHVLHGIFGPGFHRVRVDGRELAPLEGGQVDLTRISLVTLDRVRVTRRAADVVVDLYTHRHDTPVAYSRITGGTGQPGLQVLRGVFSNGFHRDFTVAGWIDLLDVEEAEGSNDRLEFRGRASWMPGTNRLGLEIEYGTQEALRDAADSAEFVRREVLLRARADLSRSLQAEVRAGTSRWRADAPPGAGEGAGGGEGEAADELARGVRELAVALRGSAGGLAGAAELRLLDAAWQPSVSGTVEVAWRPWPFLAMEAGGEAASWDGFGTAEARAGLAVEPGLPFPLRLRADAAAGRRGIPRPLEGAADSVSFRALAATAEAELGPWRVFGRASRQRLDRRHPFGDVFDRSVPPGPELEATGLEAGLEGPVLPLGALVRGLSPIRLAGWWRRASPEGEDPLYLPRNVTYGELAFRDTFFDDALEIWLVGHATRRGGTLSAGPGATDPAALPAHTWAGGHFGFRIGAFRFWYKLLDPAALGALEVPDAPFPSRVNAFGVHWEFFN